VHPVGFLVDGLIDCYGLWKGIFAPHIRQSLEFWVIGKLSMCDGAVNWASTRARLECDETDFIFIAKGRVL
jgi:hypothetical protein